MSIYGGEELSPSSLAFKLPNGSADQAVETFRELFTVFRMVQKSVFSA